MGKGPGNRGNQQPPPSSSSREHRHGIADVPRSRDGDLLASAASALRRLHFKSIGGGGRGAVPKLIVRGTSTTSETTINTSTDSANTLMTIVTTTDSEQQNDSLDLIDMCGELSPPPDEATAAGRSGAHACATTQIGAKQMNGHLSATTSPTALQNGPSTKSSLTIGPSGTNSPGPPPPTPMVGSHQESRFTFPPSDQRIRPALPDLRDADFFSQAVRGSVDAGQPDSLHISSMLALAAAKNTLKNSSNPITTTMTTTTMSPLTTASSTSTLKSQSQQPSPVNDMNGNVGDRSPSQEKSPRGSVTPTSGKPNINVTTNPLDISLCASQTQNESHPLVSTIHSWVRLFFPFCAIGANGSGCTERTAQATIVVQQPSLSLDTPPATLLLRPADARRREENMRQLLDVTNTFTLQEIHDFEMK
ncbi:hypothetical protein QAD02_023262 [Eretmocerus hayati]|uniref:Uncharacterized protein n=1 Tax=Eretmocerus hayati TaxID=131215 RepID=A0ACC2PWG4_9HYME|nr:hypothetical protein QAD02_023262 [Eretmocerus hayati]